MSRIVHLKWGEQPSARQYLIVTRLGRVRGSDFYVNRADGAERVPIGGEQPSFASLSSAIRKAETVAASCEIETIYVRLS